MATTGCALASPRGWATDSVEAALPLYAPARVHVLTDRPLYEPGHRVQFRAVALRAKDLSPLDGRPGTWTVVDPNGEVVLEERAPAGPWGVVSGAFPLDRGAPTGQLDRAVAERRYQRRGALPGGALHPASLPGGDLQPAGPSGARARRPSVEGQVLYSSGRPWPARRCRFEWHHFGRVASSHGVVRRGGLPTEVKADAAGRFRVSLPRVPQDLRGQVTLSAQRDGHGSRGGCRARRRLAAALRGCDRRLRRDGAGVQAWWRTTATACTCAPPPRMGRCCPGAELTVKRAWDAKDPGVKTVADEDGVAGSLQLDPGVRRQRRRPRHAGAPQAAPPTRWSSSDSSELLSRDEEAGLADQVAAGAVAARLLPVRALRLDPNADGTERSWP